MHRDERERIAGGNHGGSAIAFAQPVYAVGFGLLTNSTAAETVTQVVEETGRNQANVSKHLHLLHTLGFVARRKEGLFAYYRLADKDVFRLCDIMCGRLERELKVRKRMLVRRERPGP